jgi:signal transduction histidine kinase
VGSPVSWVVARTPLRGQQRTIVFGSVVLVVLLTGLVDSATGPDISLALFYLLPAVVGAVTIGTTAGVILAVEGSAVSLLADRWLHSGNSTMEVSVTNAALRLVIMLGIVWLLTALRSAVEAATASEQRSRSFLGVAAHQLRSPLTGVTTTAEALLLQGASPEQEPLLELLARDAQRAGRLVGSLLRMARLEQQPRSTPRVVDVIEAVNGHVERLHRLRSDLAVDVHRPHATAIRAFVDADALDDILGNLLENASRYARTRIEIGIDTINNGRQVSVRVADDGPGIPAGASETVFEPFVSLDASGGSGLGLAIARASARNYDGDVSYIGGGFAMTLPSAGNR